MEVFFKLDNKESLLKITKAAEIAEQVIAVDPLLVPDFRGNSDC
jgi:hypothetical protein